MHMRTSTVLPLKVHPVVCDTKNTNIEGIDELLNVVMEEPICNGWVLNHCSAAAGTGIRIIGAVRQHPQDAQLSVEELRDMVGREGEFKPCAALCWQPTRDKTVLVQAVESAHCHGGHPWSTHYLLHTQCS